MNNKSKTKKVFIPLLFCLTILFTIILGGCNASENTYSIDTNVHYSAGDDSDWSYGNQQKEFPVNKNCYVRIGVIPLSDTKNGIDQEIVVTYKFIGTNNCDVMLSDGIATLAENTETNTIEFTRVVRAQDEENPLEDVVIFQYVPKQSGSIVVEVLYDEQVDDRYNVHSTVYFSNDLSGSSNIN